MLTRNTIKHVKSLQQKKFRRELGLFVVEGGKSVKEVLASDFVVEEVFATHAFEPELHSALSARGLIAQQATQAQLVEMGSYESNDSALAVVRMKDNAPFTLSTGEYALALDDIRDPGNLGTIIRTADWFGIRKILCSEQTTEFYNPKVIAATMGSFTRITVHYTDLAAYFDTHETPAVYGAFLGGDNIHQVDFERQGGVIVIGNESHGIGETLAPAVTRRITIPTYGHAESLNAGIATAVILDNLRRSLSA